MTDQKRKRSQIRAFYTFVFQAFFFLKNSSLDFNFTCICHIKKYVAKKEKKYKWI